MRLRSLRRRAGFTLVEMTVAMTLFSVVGYALLLATNASNSSHRVVMDLATEGRELRATTETLVEELSLTSESQMTVSTLADGNHQVDLKLPIDDGGAAAWGVYETGVAHTDWQVRYTVVSASGGRELVRQVLDGQGAVRHSDVLMEGLRAGTATPPGFHAVKTGAVWVLTLTATGTAGDGSDVEEVFHVRMRN